MASDKAKMDTETKEPEGAREPLRAKYETPRVESLGVLVDLTQDTSPVPLPPPPPGGLSEDW